MLVLSTLHDLLSQLITPLDLHIAALLTPSGQLVSYAAAPSQTKDDARVLAAVGAQIWQSKSRQSPSEQSAENELGRVLVRPIGVDDPRGRAPEQAHTVTSAVANGKDADEPVMLLVLNGPTNVEWEEMQEMAQEVVNHLSPSVTPLKGRIVHKPYTPLSKEKK